MASSQVAGSTSFIGGGTNITNVNVAAAAGTDLTYLNTNVAKKADIITTPNQALFVGAVILQPSATSTLPATTINNFVFYINGQYVPTSAASFVADSIGVRVQFDTTVLQYELESDDEVIAIGKFA